MRDGVGRSGTEGKGVDKNKNMGGREAGKVVGFEPDPHLAGVDVTLLRPNVYCRSPENGSSELIPSSGSPLRFGLVLVMAWRLFTYTMEEGYGNLASRTLSCFSSTDGMGVDGSGEGDEKNDPIAHVYPFEDLHVTVATFRTLLDPPVSDQVRAAWIKTLCSQVCAATKTRDG